MRSAVCGAAADVGRPLLRVLWLSRQPGLWLSRQPELLAIVAAEAVLLAVMRVTAETKVDLPNRAPPALSVSFVVLFLLARPARPADPVLVVLQARQARPADPVLVVLQARPADPVLVRDPSSLLSS